MKYYHVESILGSLGAEYPELSIDIRFLVDDMLEHIYLLDTDNEIAPALGMEGKKCFPVFEFVKNPPFDVSSWSKEELVTSLLDTIMPVFNRLYTDEEGAKIAVYNYVGKPSKVTLMLAEFILYQSDLCSDEEAPVVGSLEPVVLEEVAEPPRVYFNSDRWSTRRPPGDFFMVDMVESPSEGSAHKRVKILGSNGQEISSLQLNLSPNSLNISAAKKVNRVQTLTRWVEEHWGDELDQISFGGSTFAFINFKGEGLCVESRSLTDPYKELQYLVNLYKLNGCTYQDETLPKNASPREFFNYSNPAVPYYIHRHPRVGFIKSRVHIKLRCDFLEAVGYFESFDVVEEAGSPFKLNFSVSFRSEHTRWL